MIANGNAIRTIAAIRTLASQVAIVLVVANRHNRYQQLSFAARTHSRHVLRTNIVLFNP